MDLNITRSSLPTPCIFLYTAQKRGSQSECTHLFQISQSACNALHCFVFQKNKKMAQTTTTPPSIIPDVPTLSGNTTKVEYTFEEQLVAYSASTPWL
uniref:Uncharacterized protein n=1 Tax=Ditylenchus dipsaci TaxID=166011 RepID=A0A915DP01_9BILA